MQNLNKWTEMTNIEVYRTGEDRNEWRRITKKAASAATINNNDTDRYRRDGHVMYRDCILQVQW